MRITRTRRVVGVVCAAAAGAALLGGCGASGPAGNAGGASGQGSSGSDAAHAVTLRGTDFAYQPAQIKMATPGDLAITLENKGMVEHDFMIEGVPGKLLVKANASGSQTFKVAKPGTYTFACTIAGHRDAGMKGTLVVG